MSPTSRLLGSLALLTTITLLGAVGYVWIEGWSFADALYMSMITVSTVGFGEILPISASGRILTMVLISFGVGTFVVVFGAVTQIITHGELRAYLGSLKLDQKIAKLKGHIVLCGGGRMATLVAEGLASKGKSFVLVEEHEERVRYLRDRGWLAIHGDATEEDVLLQAHLEEASAVIPALPSDADNLFICLIASGVNPNATIISRAEHASARSKMHRAGAHQVVLPLSTGAAQVLGLLQHSAEEIDDAEEATATLAGVGLYPMVIEVDDDVPSVKQLLREYPEVDETRAQVVALMRSDGTVQHGPARGSLLKRGDRLIVLCPTQKGEPPAAR